jgi:transaldolase
MDRLAALHDVGVSIWLDTLSRELLDTGEFAELVARRHVTGATSNPTIFAKAITGSERYESQLARLLVTGERDTRELFFALALEDVRRAADILAPVYADTTGADGFLSFECSPDLAYDTEATVTQARDLWARLQRPNTMIKVPATEAGLPAIERLTADGVNVNVTLLFSVDRYRQVMDAFQIGLEARVGAGLAVDQIASVASFFVSRVDAKVDAQLPDHSTLRGRAAIANAALAFATYRQTIAGDRWQALAAAGAQPQRPLWASTGTKNANYSDVVYVESLIAPGVDNTMPQATLDAFADHGTATDTLTEAGDAARDMLDELKDAGIDIPEITEGSNTKVCRASARRMHSSSLASTNERTPCPLSALPEHKGSWSSSRAVTDSQVVAGHMAGRDSAGTRRHGGDSRSRPDDSKTSGPFQTSPTRRRTMTEGDR